MALVATDLQLTVTEPQPLAQFLPGQWTRIGWIPPERPLPRDRWLDCSDALWEWERGRPWCIGDWILYGETQYGETYAQAMEITGLSYDRLAHYVRLCRRFNFCRRRQNLYPAHHEKVLADRFSPEEQDWWLGQSEEHGWSAAELGRQIEIAEQEARKERLVEQGMMVDVKPEEDDDRDDDHRNRASSSFTGQELAEMGLRGAQLAGALGVRPTSETGAWVQCPQCGHRWPWDRRIGEEQKREANDGEKTPLD